MRNAHLEYINPNFVGMCSVSGTKITVRHSDMTGVLETKPGQIVNARVDGKMCKLQVYRPFIGGITFTILELQKTTSR